MIQKTRWEIIANLINENDFKVIAEIGVNDCSIGRYIIEACPKVRHYICVDIRKRQEVEISNFYHDYRCIFITDSSVNSAELIANGVLDFVFIDANHTYESVKEDIKTWLPKIKKGGMISGHDYCEDEQTNEYLIRDNYGVVRAVNEIFPMVNLEQDFDTTTAKDFVWWLPV